MAYALTSTDAGNLRGHPRSRSHHGLFEKPLQRAVRQAGAAFGVRRATRATGSRAVFEPLEPRLLLAADFPMAAAVAMSDGLEQFVDRLDGFLDDTSEFDQRLPFLLSIREVDGIVEDKAPSVSELFSVAVDANGDGSIAGSGVEAQLAGFDTSGDEFVDAGELLNGLFFAPLQKELVSGPTDAPAFEAFLLDSMRDQTIDLGNGTVIDFTIVDAATASTTEDPDAEVTFEIAFELSIVQPLPIDLGLDADALKLLPFTGPDDAPEPPSVPVTSTLNFGFEIGVFTGGQSDAEIDGDDFFIRRADPLLATIVSDVDPLGFDLNIGFLGAEVVGGKLDLLASIETTLLDPDDPGVLGFGADQRGDEDADGTVVAAGMLPDPDLAMDAGLFLRIGHLGIATAVSVADIDRMTEAELQTDLQTALGPDLGALVTASIIGGQVQFALPATTGTPLGFSNESALEAMNNGLDGTLTATPDGDAGNVYEFTEDQVFLLSVGGELPKLVTVQFPDPAHTDIGFDFDQSADLVDDLTASNDAVANGVLSGDATFSVRVTDANGLTAVTVVTVTRASTDGTAPLTIANTSRADLAADLNAALASAGVGTQVEASVSDDRLVLSEKAGSNVGAIRIEAADAETAAELGFTAGQQVTPKLTAAMDAITSGDLSGAASFDITVNGGPPTTVTVAVDASNNNAADLAVDIDAALSSAGVPVSATLVGSRVVLSADGATTGGFEIAIGNQDIDDLVDDVNAALADAGLGGAVTASADGTDLMLSSAGVETLEITHTLTFDAGVTGSELADPPAGADDNELFLASTSPDSNITFTLPVEVLAGLEDGSSGLAYDPQDVAIVGNFNPFSGAVATFDAAEQRFRLALAVDPPDPDDPAILVPDAEVDLNEEIRLVNFAELLQFNVVSAESMVGLLSQFGGALEQIVTDGAFSQYGVPFTDAVLSDLLVLRDLVQSELIYDVGSDGVVNDDPAIKNQGNPALTNDGERSRLLERVVLPQDGSETVELLPSFVTAQALAARLATLLGVPTGPTGINAIYHPVTNELSYDVTIDTSDRIAVGIDDGNNTGPDDDLDGDDDDDRHPFDVPFAFNVDFSAFGLREFTVDDPLNASVSLAGHNQIDMSFGVDLDPEAPLELDTSLATLNNESGIGIKTPLAVTADAPVASEFGIGSDTTFAVRVDGGAPVTVNITRAAVEAGDGSLPDLLAAIQAGFDAAGLAVTVGTAPLGDPAITALQFDAGLAIQLLPLASDPNALTDLGFDAGMLSGMVVTADTPVPQLLRINTDATLTIDVTASTLPILAPFVGTGSVDVVIEAADTAGNRTIAAVVSDVNNALRDAGLLVRDAVTGVESGIIATFDADRLVLSGTDASTAFSLTAVAGNSAVDGLGFAAATTVASDVDFEIIDRAGIRHAVSLDSLVGGTVQDLLGVINAATPATLIAGLNPAGTALRLTDNGPVFDDGILNVATVNGSLAALKLGLLTAPRNPDDPDNVDAGGPDRPPNIIDGGPIGTEALTDRFFVRDTAITGELTMDLPSGGIDGDALFGIVGVDVTLDGGLAGTLEYATELKAPGLPGGSLVTLAQLQGEADVFTAPLVSRDPLETHFGTFTLDVAVKPGFADAGFGTDIAIALNGLSETLAVNLVEFGDPNASPDPLPPVVSTDTTPLGALLDFQALEYDDLAAALQQLEAALIGLEADYPLLSQVIPLVNITVSELLGLSEPFAVAVDGFDRVIDDALALLDPDAAEAALLTAAEVAQRIGDVPTFTLQDLPEVLRVVFGLPDDSAGVVVDLDPLLGARGQLTIDLSLGQEISTSLGLDVELVGLPNLTSGKVLQATGNLDLDLKIGIDLDDPAVVVLYDTDGDGNPTGLSGDLQVFGFGAEDLGLVFQAVVGQLPIQVLDGVVDMSLAFDLQALMFGTQALSDIDLADFAAVETSDFNASLPLFDPAGGLTGFIDEIVVSGDLTTGISTPDLTDLIAAVAALAADPDFNPLDNLLHLADNIDFFLEALQDYFDSTLFALGLPLVGNNLAEGARFIENFRAPFVNELRTLIESKPDVSVADISTLIQGFFAGAGITVDNLVASSDLANPDFADRFASWTFELSEQITIPFDLGFDLGIPLLNLDLDIPLDITLDWILAIGFGVDRATGSFIDLSGVDDLSVDLDIGLAAGEHSGTLGFLEVIVNDAASAGLALEFDVDFTNATGLDPDLLAFSDLGSLDFTSLLSGDDLGGGGPVLDLLLTLGVKGLPSVVFPQLSTHLMFDWDLDPTDINNLFGGGNAVAEGLQSLAFSAIELDAGSFLNDFLGATLSRVLSAIEPVSEVIDVLTARLPIVSDLAGEKITLLDLAATFGEVDDEFIDWVEEANSVLGTITGLAGSSLPVGIGSLNIFNVAGTGAITDLVTLFDGDLDIGDIIDLAGAAGVIATPFGDALDAAAGPGNAIKDTTESLLGGDLLNFPFLQDTTDVIGFLLGQDANLLEVDIPALVVGFDYEQLFPIFGPLSASIIAGFSAGVDFSFGYNTVGLQRFADSGFTNPGLIFDGFFFGDRADVTTGADIPEVFLQLELSGTAQLNVGFARAGIGGGVTALIAWDFVDPDNNGAINLNELENIIDGQLLFGDAGLAPVSPFDLIGELSFRLFAFLVIDLGVFEIEYFFDITPKITLLDFSFSIDRPPLLATDLDDGTLQLNMGPNAQDRLFGDTRDGDEEFVVERNPTSGVISVSSPSLGIGPQAYGSHFTRIVGLGGAGNDRITLIGFDNDNTISADLRGGAGNDTIEYQEDALVTGAMLATGGGAMIRGGPGNDTLIGSHLNDIISGDEGNDTIEGGRGFDVLFGDGGDITSLDADSNSIGYRIAQTDGNDTIRGGSSDVSMDGLAAQDADDIIIGGGGRDGIFGDAGNDVILGDGGRFAYDLVDGHIDVASLRPDAFDPNDPTDPNPTTTTSQKIQDILVELTAPFSATDFGAGANDTIYGGSGNVATQPADGDDFIFGGAADDEIHAEAGADYVVGGAGFDIITGGLGNDTLFGNAQGDRIDGNEGDDVISGGFGDDTLHGNDGDDAMVGGRGRDVMFGDADDDEVFGEGEPDVLFGGAGDDLVVGGVGADIMFGDDGLIAKLDPAGPSADEVIVGNGSPALITVGMREAADANIGSLDLILTDPRADDGDDFLSGDAGGDIILGGGGDDLIGGDVDPRQLAAAAVNEVGRDILIGDGGIVQFDLRRLQYIASVVDLDPTSFQDTIFGDDGRDVIIGGQGSDNGTNVLDRTRLLAGGHGPGRGATNPLVNDDDIIIGDNGELVYADDSTPGNFGKLERVRTTDMANATGGADTVAGEADDDIIFGGVNASIDVLDGNAGNDIILGDNGVLDFGFDGDTDLTTLDLIRSFDDNLGGIDIISGNAGRDVLIGGTAGDTMYGDDAMASAGADDGTDIVIGDNADIFLIGTVGELIVRGTAVDRIVTTDAVDATGGADTIAGNAAADVVIGGVNNGGTDVLYGDAALASLGVNDRADLILGDNAEIDFSFDDDDRTTLDRVRSLADNLGGADTISGDVAGDLIIGGTAGDVIHGDNAIASAADQDGDDIVLGDNGEVLFSGFNEKARIILGAAVQRITTTDDEEGTGGADLIEGNAGADLLIGGVNGAPVGIDRVYGDALSPDAANVDRDDVLLGDNGVIDFDFVAGVPAGDGNLSTLDRIASIARSSLDVVLGAVDHLFGNAGNDTVIGGSDGDLIIGDNDESLDDGVVDVLEDDPGDDILIGDQGEIVRANDLVTTITTTDVDATEGGVDTVQGNDGADIILGGVAGDLLHGEAELVADGLVVTVVGAPGNDIIVGDEGRLRYDVASSAGVTVDGDLLVAGDDDPHTLDLIETFATGVLGGDDDIYGNGGDDVAMGGSGNDRIFGDFYLGSLVRALAPGEDVLLGDGGQMTFIDTDVTLLRTIEPGEGGSDLIEGNDLDDTIMGGFAADELYGEARAAELVLTAGRAGDDVILGDNGRLDWILPDDDVLGRQDVVDHLGGTLVMLDPDPGTLDRITTTDPTLGGDDVIYGNGNSATTAGDLIFGGTGSDTVRGDTSDAGPGADGPDGMDLAFGDHGKSYPSLAAVDGFFLANDFFSIDTDMVDLGAGDVMFGNGNDDIMIGGQGDDVMFGGADDDDLIGGHNIAGSRDPADGEPAHDDLDPMDDGSVLAIAPTELADLNPADANEINDIIDGGSGDDVMAGDNAIIVRQGDDLSPRFRTVGAGGTLYTLVSNAVNGGLADIDVGFAANVTDAFRPHQDMTLVRTVTLLDHSELIEDAAVDAAADPRPFGNDVMAGGADDDELWGQLGEDIMQGDGTISVDPAKLPDDFDDYDPAQDQDPSFDLRNFFNRTDLLTSTEHTLRWQVAESLEDGDDYAEGNGGNDRMYGNLGQDDLIGGSSTLFGLGDDDALFQGVAAGVLLRPDGADLIYGGAGNPDLLARNASFGGPDNDITGATLVPADERHATDADTILGDNGDIFRIVVDIAAEEMPADFTYERFAYDRDGVTLAGFVDDGYDAANPDDEINIRPRAVNFADYGYTYVDEDGDPATRETLTFLPTARGEGDLIYGETGDDVVHGMTGNDVIFGGSEHDDLHGEIGTDFLLGGTGIDGIVGDDGLVLTSRNDLVAEALHGVAALNPEQVNIKRNDPIDTRALNAVITTPGNIQVAQINHEEELVKAVELFAFRTDDLDGQTTGEFEDALRFNDIVFGGLDNDFIHSGDGDDAVSGAEALATYFSGGGLDFVDVNTFLENMQSDPPNGTPDLADRPFWFDFAPFNPGDILRFEGKTIVDENGQNARTRDEFAWYDEFNPRRKILFDFDHDFAGPELLRALASETGVAKPIDFLLNFDEDEGALGPLFDGEEQLPSDGADRLFGDAGNDWLVGGTDRDHMYGGRGDDLVNMDDNHDSGAGGRQKPHDPPPDPLDNTQSDEFQAYADIVYSGAGRDVMILNTGADRAIDWVGEYNSYIVPFSPFGAFHISRTLQPQVPEFLFALSVSDGIDARVDASLANNVVDAQLYVDQKNLDVRVDDPDPLRNGEPFGELGMVRQTDFDWQEQTGAPNDPQPGNFGGKREIMRRELFSDAAAAAFAADVGNFSVADGVLNAAPSALGEETVALFHLDQLQPDYTEVLVTVNADKDKAGSKSNAYIIFDYQGPENFKFAGIEVGTDKLQIGQRTADGWIVEAQVPDRLRANTDYDLTLVLHGSLATIWVDETTSMSFDFNETLNGGGMFGLGTQNANARFDDFQVQKLPPLWTLDDETTFDDAALNPLTPESGTWTVGSGALTGLSSDDAAITLMALDVEAFTRLELQTRVSTAAEGGLVFDYYGATDYKFVVLDVANDQVAVGHVDHSGTRIDSVATMELDSGVTYELQITMLGTAVSVAVDGVAVVANAFNGLLNDGGFGLLAVGGTATFENFVTRSDDPALQTEGEALTAAQSQGHGAAHLSTEAIAPLAGEAIERLVQALGLDESQRHALDQVTFVVTDLDGPLLAQAIGSTVYLDVNAAGNGWFVDPTPATDEEFASSGPARSADGIDLLSVLSHELGHVLGIEHEGPDFMAPTLDVGQRTAPESEPEPVHVYDDERDLVLDRDTYQWLARLDLPTAGLAETAIDDWRVISHAETASDDSVSSLIQWTRGRIVEHIQE